MAAKKMEVTLTLNGRTITREIAPDLVLYDFLRAEGCASVKCGCETSNCGLCTVLMDDHPILSCSILTARAAGHSITTLEGEQELAREIGGFLADQAAEQCGFCTPGNIMTVIGLLRENPDPTVEELWAYLAGNLCRCTGYEGQKRAFAAYLEWRREQRRKMSEVDGSAAGGEC